MDPVAFGAACDFGRQYTAKLAESGRRELGRRNCFGSAA